MEAREHARQARQRRGGFGDSGVHVCATGLPGAPPVPLSSLAELRAELEGIAALLGPSVEWTQRVNALIRLEGLAKGGAAGFAAFPELLLGMRDVLAAQMQERRSAVSRQACHAVAELAGACGISFEPLALHLLPVVFSTLAMGIQVVSQVADACAHAMLAHCPSHRLLTKLCTVISSDKNGRLRQSAAEYLLHALEAWEPAEWGRQLEAVERAVLAAVQDAQGETRAVGRTMYGALARSWPAQAHALLGRLGREKQLQEKLVQAAQEYVPGMLPEGMCTSQPVSRRSSLGNSGSTTPRGLARTSSMPTVAAGVHQGGAVRLAPAVPKLALSAVGSAAESRGGSPSHPASSSARSAGVPAASTVAVRQPPASARENYADNRSAAAAAAVPCTPRSMFPKSLARRDAAAAAAAADVGGEPEPSRLQPAAARERLAPRRSLGGAALRMSIATFRRQQDHGETLDEEEEEGDGSQCAAQRMPGPQRPPLPVSHDAEQQQQAEQHVRPFSARRVGVTEDELQSFPDSAASSVVSGGGWEEPTQPPANLASLLAGLGKAGIAWVDRVTLFQSLQAAMQKASASQHIAADMASNADRLVAALLEGCGDAHFRTATAALAALEAGLASPSSRVFEPQLDRVMTVLFARVVDPKEQIRQLVGASLAAVLQQQTADAAVVAVARSLQANRAPKVKCAVMEFFASAVRRGSSEAAAAEGEQAPALLLNQLTGTVLAGLVRSMLHLATDKNPDIRRTAADAVAAAYHAGEAQAQVVLAAVHALPPADSMAVQRAIRPAIQQQGGEPGLSASPTRSSRATSAASSRSGSLSVRRHSAEGLQQPAAQQQRRRPESGNLSSRSRQSSRPTSPQKDKQQAATVAAAPPLPPAAAASAKHTPEPPSPFAWREQSGSPLPPAVQPAEDAAEQQQQQQHSQQLPAAAEDAAAAAPELQVGISAAAMATHQLASMASMVSDLTPFDDVMAGQLQRLLSQLEQGPSCEALQGLSRLARVLPAAAWQSCFHQVTTALCLALDSSSMVVVDAGLMAARDLAAAVAPSLFLPALPAVLPRLLACVVPQEAREVAVAADEALDQLLQRAPPQTCLGLLLPRLPSADEHLSVDRQAGAALHATVCSLRRVVTRMQPAGLSAHLQPLLVPGLCAAFQSPMSDVRKATVDCLVSIWQVVGGALDPHLQPLSASQRKLLEIYRARSTAV